MAILLLNSRNITNLIVDIVLKFSVLIGWISGCLLAKIPPFNLKLVQLNADQENSAGQIPNCLKNPMNLLILFYAVCNIVNFNNSLMFIKQSFGDSLLSEIILINYYYILTVIYDMIRRGFLVFASGKILKLLSSYYSVILKSPAENSGTILLQHFSGNNRIGWIIISIMLFSCLRAMIIVPIFGFITFTDNPKRLSIPMNLIYMTNLCTGFGASLFAKLLITIIGLNLKFQYESMVNEYLVQCILPTTMEKQVRNSIWSITDGRDQWNLHDSSNIVKTIQKTKQKQPGEKLSKRNCLSVDWDHSEYQNRFEQLVLQFDLYNEVFGYQIGLFVLESITTIAGQSIMILSHYVGPHNFDWKFKLRIITAIIEGVLSLLLIGHIGESIKRQVINIYPLK